MGSKTKRLSRRPSIKAVVPSSRPSSTRTWEVYPYNTGSKSSAICRCDSTSYYSERPAKKTLTASITTTKTLVSLKSVSRVQTGYFYSSFVQQHQESSSAFGAEDHPDFPHYYRRSCCKQRYGRMNVLRWLLYESEDGVEATKSGHSRIRAGGHYYNNNKNTHSSGTKSYHHIDENDPNNSGALALHYAAARGCLDCVKLLVESSPDFR